MKKLVVGLFLLGLFLINAFLTSVAHADITLAFYDGRWSRGLFYPLMESMTFDVPAKGLTSPCQYPYVFKLNEPSRVYLQIRHFLWAYDESCSNHLTIRIDNEPVLNAYSPRAGSPDDWYPGGDGVQLVYLGMRAAGTHYLTMTCNITDFYTVDWWKILLIQTASGVSRLV